MYTIEKTDYGYRLTFADAIAAPEMRAWLEESRIALATHDGPFCVLVDMRRLKPLDNDAKAIMVKGQHTYRKEGMRRSVVVVEHAALLTQFRLLARSSGIHVWEHYINASETPDWEEKAMGWLVDGILPRT